MIVIILFFVDMLWLMVPAVRMDLSSPERGWGKKNNIWAWDVIGRYIALWLLKSDNDV